MNNESPCTNKNHIKYTKCNAFLVCCVKNVIDDELKAGRLHHSATTNKKIILTGDR